MMARARILARFYRGTQNSGTWYTKLPTNSVLRSSRLPAQSATPLLVRIKHTMSRVKQASRGPASRLAIQQRYMIYGHASLLRLRGMAPVPAIFSPSTKTRSLPPCSSTASG